MSGQGVSLKHAQKGQGSPSEDGTSIAIGLFTGVHKLSLIHVAVDHRLTGLSRHATVERPWANGFLDSYRGYADGSYRPGRTITRGEVAVILYRFASRD